MKPAVVFLAAACGLLAACSARVETPGWKTGGDPRQGKAVIAAAECGACHQIPGVPGADGQVGPPLSAFARRTIIAGVLPNTPDNLVRWLREPQGVKPGDAMPNTGLSDRQARDAAAYLYGLS